MNQPSEKVTRWCTENANRAMRMILSERARLIGNMAPPIPRMVPNERMATCCHPDHDCMYAELEPSLQIYACIFHMRYHICSVRCEFHEVTDTDVYCTATGTRWPLDPVASFEQIISAYSSRDRWDCGDPMESGTVRIASVDAERIHDSEIARRFKPDDASIVYGDCMKIIREAVCGVDRIKIEADRHSKSLANFVTAVVRYMSVVFNGNGAGVVMFDRVTQLYDAVARTTTVYRSYSGNEISSFCETAAQHVTRMWLMVRQNRDSRAGGSPSAHRVYFPGHGAYHLNMHCIVVLNFLASREGCVVMGREVLPGMAHFIGLGLDAHTQMLMGIVPRVLTEHVRLFREMITAHICSGGAL